MKSEKRITIINAVERAVAAGKPLCFACRDADISTSTYDRWKARLADAPSPSAVLQFATPSNEVGAFGASTVGVEHYLPVLADKPRSGRPAIQMNEADAQLYKETLIRSNKSKGAGSARMTAWVLAKTGKFEPELCEKVVDTYENNRHLPASVQKVAWDVSAAMVRRFRSKKEGQGVLDGIHAHGWLRMYEDGSRYLRPGERQCWDDATVNFAVCIPCPVGPDAPFGFKVARYQLLLGIDCATGMPIGYSYVVRENNAYRGEDIVRAFIYAWAGQGHVPESVVLEGGAWQSNIVKDFLRQAGVKIINAKGRAKQKLVEEFFNPLWTVLSILMKPESALGRFRGEYPEGTVILRKCQDGKLNPHDFFPTLNELQSGLNNALNLLAIKPIPSRTYGSLPAPATAYIGFTPLPLRCDLLRFALPERRELTVMGNGALKTMAHSPDGGRHEYWFNDMALHVFAGQKVIVQFDTQDIERGAVVALARGWRDHKEGEIIALAKCVSHAPAPLRPNGRFDNRPVARRMRSESRALVVNAVAALDTRTFAHSPANAALPESPTRRLLDNPVIEAEWRDVPTEVPDDYDMEAAERAAGIW